MDVSHIIDPLNDAQREAVTAQNDHLLVLAGAGSGKTRVLVHRIAWLMTVDRVPPTGILAVTFTNKAAKMRYRIEEMMNIPPGDCGSAPSTASPTVCCAALERRRPAGEFPGARQRRPAAHGQAGDARVPD